MNLIKNNCTDSSKSILESSVGPERESLQAIAREANLKATNVEMTSLPFSISTMYAMEFINTNQIEKEIYFLG